MKHEMTQWKCFVPDTPSFCNHIWSCVDLFSEIEHKTALVSIIITMDTQHLEKLVIVFTQIYGRVKFWIIQMHILIDQFTKYEFISTKNLNVDSKLIF